MIRAKLPYNTMTIEINGNKHFCAYCGKELQYDYESGDSLYDEPIHYYHCDCEMAKKEIELQQNIDKLNSELYRKREELIKLHASTKYTKQIVKK